ncbi:MAG: hypothetical protein P1V97_27925 [Planctomycetota bacterium]|nr:hypothetical protein [Planctomycetota bacterium]
MRSLLASIDNHRSFIRVQAGESNPELQQSQGCFHSRYDLED